MVLSEKHINKLESIVSKDRCKTTTAELYAYAFDASIHRRMPDVVVRPLKAEEISDILKFANEEKIPVVPRGAGTALCGHAVPIDGGILLDMQGMKKIIEVKPNDFYCVVEPGVVCDDLNDELAKYNFFIPGPASSEAATIGGMVAANASGSNALKYGATRDLVRAMQVVMPTGKIVRVGSKTIKNATGYQLEKLFCGMEGTLAVITEATIKIIPKPEKEAGLMAAFEKIKDAGQVVADIAAKGIIPSQLEIMSEVAIKAVNKATGLGLPEVEAILLIRVDGHPAEVTDNLKKIKIICEENNSGKLEFTEDTERLAELWKGRKQMIPSLSAINEDLVTTMLADDMAVPISKVPEAIVAFQKISDKYDIEIPPYGHAGDGNLHTKVLMDPTNPDHWKQADKAVEEIYDVVLDLGGTITGEHGVAITKTPYFKKEKGELYDVLKAIKRALDPNNILNPHKIQDWDEGFITHLRYPVKIEGKEA